MENGTFVRFTKFTLFAAIMLPTNSLCDVKIKTKKEPLWVIGGKTHEAVSVNPKETLMNGYGRFSKPNPIDNVSMLSNRKIKREKIEETLLQSLISKNEFLMENQFTFKTLRTGEDTTRDIKKVLEQRKKEFFDEKIDRDSLYYNASTPEQKEKRFTKRYEYYLEKNRESVYENIANQSQLAYDWAPKSSAWFWLFNAGCLAYTLPQLNRIELLEKIIKSNDQKKLDHKIDRKKLYANALYYYTKGYAKSMFTNWILNLGASAVVKKLNPSASQEKIDSTVAWGLTIFDLLVSPVLPKILPSTMSKYLYGSEPKNYERLAAQAYVRSLKNKPEQDIHRQQKDNLIKNGFVEKEEVITRYTDWKYDRKDKKIKQYDVNNNVIKDVNLQGYEELDPINPIYPKNENTCNKNSFFGTLGKDCEFIHEYDENGKVVEKLKRYDDKLFFKKVPVLDENGQPKYDENGQVIMDYKKYKAKTVFNPERVNGEYEKSSTGVKPYDLRTEVKLY